MRAKRNLGGNFNLVAPVYDTLAFIVFGHRLQQAQSQFLSQIPTDASVLLVGGGAGWLLEQILLTCQPKQIIYLETSSQMIALASKRMLRKSLTGSVDFRLGDESALLPDEQFDVIITPFVLDLFTEAILQNTFIPALLNVLKPTGLWLVTDFVIPNVWWQKALLWFMIRFFRLTAGIETKTLANWQQCLAQAALVRRERKPQVKNMVSAEVWARAH